MNEASRFAALAVCLLAVPGHAAEKKKPTLHEIISESFKDESYKLDKVKSLLDGGSDPNGEGADRGAPIVNAACGGYDSIIALLLERGADVNLATKSQDWTALHCAAANKRYSTVKLLLERGAKCCQDSATGTPAETAAKNEAPGVARLIEKAAAAQKPATSIVPLPHACNRDRGWPGSFEHGFRMAVQEGNLIRVKAALENGARINQCNKHGVSVLAHTLYYKQDAMARFLIENGARPSDEQERVMIAKMLGESGAPPAPAQTAAAVAAAPAAVSEQAVLPPFITPSFTARPRPGDLAVVIGIESYSDIATKAPYAERDADAVKAHLLALGVPERNIVLLKGSKAGRASLEKNLESWLPRLAKPESRVYFYFSGHGAPDVKTGQAYIVPWDGDPNFLENTAYPVARLYKQLGELPVKQVLIAMDSCFSGSGGRSVLASGARPLVGKIETGAVPAKITVLAASAANEISGSLDDKGHGAFTYFLLQGLGAGKTTPQQLVEYLTPRVQDEARRLNRDQTPQLQGDGSWSLR